MTHHFISILCLDSFSPSLVHRIPIAVTQTADSQDPDSYHPDAIHHITKGIIVQYNELYNHH